MDRAKQLYDKLPEESQRVNMRNETSGIEQRVHDCNAVVTKLFDLLDVDNADGLTFPQFTTLMMNLLKEEANEDPVKRQTRETERLQGLFMSLDHDNDGFITNQELAGALSGMKPAADEKEVRDIMTEITGGRMGEMIRQEQLGKWAKDTEQLAKMLVPLRGH
eukprot:GHVS01047116.1.p2 GENE.GHVS01047116.1~~GHVS01047116.1.p2  ORF type:complete len:163 (-),score=21.65 GHVS01047116.1:193-681(-)